jgi:glutathione S-transferase
MKLYHHALSSSSRRVTLTAHCLGQRLDEHLINLASPEDRVLLGGVNPNVKIPVLQDGDLLLWESHAIMQYLCEKAGLRTSLYPADLRARIDVNRWLFWTSSHLAPAVAPINFERMWKKFGSGGDADPALVARYEGVFHLSAKVLEGHLGDGDRTWVSGRDLTLADLSIGATLMYAERTQLPLEAYPRLRAYRGRIKALEAWQATEPQL